MHKTLTLIFMFLSLGYGFAQNDTTANQTPVKDTVWLFEGTTSFNFTQGHLENWTQGGENFLSTLLMNEYTIEYRKKRSSWENTFNYKLGGTQQGDQKLKKNEDIFELNSKYGYDISNKNIFFSNIINFKTQFFKTFDYANDNDSVAVSRFLNPGYLVIASGFEYKHEKILSAMLSPASGKATFMADTTKYDPVAYGIDNGNQYKAEIGAYMRMKFKLELLKSIKINSSVELFNNYFNKPENIDVDWQTTITFSVNEYIKTVIFTHLIYDDDIPIPTGDGETTKAIQFKETIGIGIAYNIN